MSKTNKILIGVLTVFLAVSAAFNLKLRNNVISEQKSSESLKKALYELSMEHDSILSVNDSINQVLSNYSYIIDSLDLIIDNNEKDITWLNHKLKEAEKEIYTITTDSMYIKLKEIYECGDVNNIFAFTDCETRDIYTDVIKIPILRNIVAEQDNLINNQKLKLDLHQQMVTTLTKDNESKKELIDRLYIDLANGTVKLDVCNQDKQRVEEILSMWKKGSIGVGSVLLLLLIIL